MMEVSLRPEIEIARVQITEGGTAGAWGCAGGTLADSVANSQPGDFVYTGLTATAWRLDALL
jgi:hypothetical protein